LYAIQHIREIWANVPCLLIVREPSEVLASVFRKRPGWLKFKTDSDLMARLSGISPSKLNNSSEFDFSLTILEQYYDICFRFVQCFPMTSKVVDYRKLIGGAVGFQEIWDFFGLKPLDVEVQKNCLATYSKSRNMKDYYDA